MRFKPFLLTLAAALVLAASALTAFAQVTQASGKVTLKQADGTEVPVAGAQVDIYRTDIKWETHVKTDKKGQWLHAGIPFVGTYTIIVSAPGARPSFATGIKFSRTPNYDFTLDPGDGSKLTLDQLKAAGSNAGAKTPPPGTGESKEAKEAREKAEKENERIKAENEKITSANETVSRAFKAGNEALNATPPRIEEAITAYREGLAARADEPALLTNLSEALRRRGVDRYNAAIKETDNDAKTQGMDAAKKDWVEAATISQKAVDLIKTSTGGDPNQQSVYAQNKVAALSTRAYAMKFVATKVDQTKSADAWAAFQELMETEVDPAKKAKMRTEALQMLFDSGNTEMTMVEAQKILAENPDDVDANRIMGLALFATNDKTKFQQAANYLQRYVDKAPDTDQLKESAKAALDYLKTAENIKPEKSQPTRTNSGGRRRP